MYATTIEIITHEILCDLYAKWYWLLNQVINISDSKNEKRDKISDYTLGPRVW